MNRWLGASEASEQMQEEACYALKAQECPRSLETSKEFMGIRRNVLRIGYKYIKICLGIPLDLQKQQTFFLWPFQTIPGACKLRESFGKARESKLLIYTSN